MYIYNLFACNTTFLKRLRCCKSLSVKSRFKLNIHTYAKMGWFQDMTFMTSLHISIQLKYCHPDFGELPTAMTECFSKWLSLAASQRLDNASGEDFSHLIVIAIDSAHLIVVSLFHCHCTGTNCKFIFGVQYLNPQNFEYHKIKSVYLGIITRILQKFGTFVNVLCLLSIN